MSLEISEERGVRFLHFGSPYIQGAMRIARPYALELEYTRELMLPLVLRGDRNWPASVLQVGLGAASVTRFLLRHRPDARLTVIEIQPEVVATARRYFKLPEDDARLEVIVDDGAQYVMGTRRKFDLVVVDGFDGKGRMGMLDSVAFHLNCRERLARRGMVALNFLTRHRGAEPAIARVREAYGEHSMPLPMSEAGNKVVIAGNYRFFDGDIEALRASAVAMKAATGLNLLPTVARLEALGA